MHTAILTDCLTEIRTRALERQLAGHLEDAEALWTILYRSTEQARGELDGELPRILIQAADTAMQRRNYAAAGDYSERALRLLDRIADAGGPVDRETRIRAINVHAASCRLTGRWQQAEQALQMALMEFEFSLGEDHPEVAAAWSELAMVYVAMNQHASAERAWTRAMEVSARSQVARMSWPVYCAYNPEIAAAS
jgi:tetratricopeptide (TPR) repeat protein